IDRKGITDRVTLSGMTLMNWQVHLLPLTDAWVRALPRDVSPGTRPGLFFRGSFTMETPTDTYLDLSRYKKGVVWVNGHNIGRFWEIGPQQRLYVPATMLRRGRNDVVVLDLLATEAAPVSGAATLK
ncbi:MAG: beta galactosidase jelly roll domain-containing protein, partial [Gemmatimonadaceae bacterium]|nr:beta galactosidase jelly roll domain-containing protein [Gemmatimonadaceae bacterium]